MSAGDIRGGELSGRHSGTILVPFSVMKGRDIRGGRHAGTIGVPFSVMRGGHLRAVLTRSTLGS